MYSDTFERWLDTYRINTASYFFTSFAFLPLLAKAKTEGGAVEPGNILNISVSYVARSKSKELRNRCGG
jgi:NAD(P)-dependent dehydrogenase (short-subunit alcohol dehydrogenase family)